MSDQSDAVINYVKKTGITTRKALLQKFYRDIDPMTLANVEVLMQQMGAVKIRLNPETGDKTYIWIGEE